DRLLYLTSIRTSADQDDLAREVDSDDRLGAHAVPFGIGFERSQIHERELRHEILEFGGNRSDQKLTNEQGMPGQLGEDSSLDPIFGIRSAIEILSEKSPPPRVRNEVFVQEIELFGRELAVAFPPHRISGEGIAYGMFVLRAAPGVNSRCRAK